MGPATKCRRVPGSQFQWFCLLVNITFKVESVEYVTGTKWTQDHIQNEVSGKPMNSLSEKAEMAGGEKGTSLREFPWLSWKFSPEFSGRTTLLLCVAGRPQLAPRSLKEGHLSQGNSSLRLPPKSLTTPLFLLLCHVLHHHFLMLLFRCISFSSKIGILLF